ncbi:hypothetical protein C6503_13280, partial [Candidatus Poribacteria bacterium]
MKQHIQTTFLGLAIFLILTAFVVNAETPKTTTSQVNYGYYYLLDDLKEHYRFLLSPAPEGLHYHIRMTATANIDDTPEKETIALIVVDTKPRTFSSNGALSDNYIQAFLLITNWKGSKIEKKPASNFLTRGRIRQRSQQRKASNFTVHPPVSSYR